VGGGGHQSQADGRGVARVGGRGVGGQDRLQLRRHGKADVDATIDDGGGRLDAVDAATNREREQHPVEQLCGYSCVDDACFVHVDGEGERAVLGDVEGALRLRDPGQRLARDDDGDVAGLILVVAV